MRVGEPAFAELVSVQRVVPLLLVFAPYAVPRYWGDVRVSAGPRIASAHRRVATYVALAGWTLELSPLCRNFTSDLGR